MSGVNIQNSQDLLAFLINQSNSGSKNWFGFHEQRLAGISLVYKIAENHADKLEPAEIVDFVQELNNQIYLKFLRAGDGKHV